MQYSSLFISAVLSAGLMPLIMDVARTNGLYDTTGSRKIHSGQVPRLGGIGMFLAFLAVVVVFPFVVGNELKAQLSGRVTALLPLLIGAFLVHAIGLIDDVKGVPARLKLIVQIAAAAIVVAGGGYRFMGLGYVSDRLASDFSWLSYILTIGWIVGVTNALNLIDGLDGLAGGLAFIASIAFAAFYFFAGDDAATFLCLALAGAIAGFLFVNFPAPKAKMFMGDSGSLFLGFSLSVIPFLGHSGGSSARIVGVTPALVLLIIPVFDTLRAMYRRWAAHVSFSTPDRLHIHHLFFDSGYKPIAILGILYSAAAFQAIVFVVASRMPSYLSLLVELISFILISVLFRFATSLRPPRI